LPKTVRSAVLGTTSVVPAVGVSATSAFAFTIVTFGATHLCPKIIEIVGLGFHPRNNFIGFSLSDDFLLYESG
jgi:hypothetical protein